MRPWPIMVALVAGTLAGAGFSSASAAAEPPKVVATIPPIHSLAAAVMAGAGEPAILVRGNASPHGYQLRPSEAAAIQDADVVVWVGPGFETFMERPLGNLGAGTRVVTLLEAPGVERLPAREGGAWEARGDETEEHHQGAEGDHGHGEHDPHAWFSPANAQAMVRAIAAAVTAADPERASLYRTNEERTVQELAALDEELDAALAPVRGKPFVVFHDAYQYLEAAYGLHAAGSITVSPDRPPSARRLVELAEKIERSGVVCIFGEVQAASPLVGTLIADGGIGTGQLDPEGGTTVTPGPKAYAELMRRNVDVLVDCLSRSS